MKRALIVNNSASERRSIKKLLENSGFVVVGEAENGLRGIKFYHELNPDFVTMDISMPELDGIETLKIIKKIDKDARIFIIASSDHEQKVQEAMESGAVGFILKSFSETKDECKKNK
ncbi:response regulator containing a CheY-like receiver domain and an HTH DNA-binding domain [Desulfosporosinus acidiphilus SJ4]|uniref:Stage 0 sporulation protein A homolog n=1 Tax=Desulfosporosinus acidiphilus (strain DSM 22704 / JCM 16185 / SJ4) TaxID=646529 RepID=I4D1R3_DESAJ|nr:response regulator [Desulfosporosinus acidiphilus]AFM39737.1 response regulator containing a CheY-like receiver domain and an HTH DNA-binding domain [Desulfosporosinus acidiphilus SJ4]